MVVVDFELQVEMLWIGYFVVCDELWVDWVECVEIFVFVLLVVVFDLLFVFGYIVDDVVVCDVIECVCFVDVFVFCVDYDVQFDFLVGFD